MNHGVPRPSPCPCASLPVSPPVPPCHLVLPAVSPGGTRCRPRDSRQVAPLQRAQGGHGPVPAGTQERAGRGKWGGGGWGGEERERKGEGEREEREKGEGRERGETEEGEGRDREEREKGEEREREREKTIAPLHSCTACCRVDFCFPRPEEARTLQKGMRQMGGQWGVGPLPGFPRAQDTVLVVLPSLSMGWGLRSCVRVCKDHWLSNRALSSGLPQPHGLPCLRSSQRHWFGSMWVLVSLCPPLGQSIHGWEEAGTWHSLPTLPNGVRSPHKGFIGRITNDRKARIN